MADAGASDVQAFSAPASAAWLLLDRPRTHGEIARALRSTFGGARAEVDAHVGRLLVELVAGGWVVRTAPDG